MSVSLGFLVLSVALEGAVPTGMLVVGGDGGDPGAAPSALQRCWRQADTRVELKPCLEDLLREAERRLDAARVVVDRKAGELDRVIGERAENVARTRASHEAWEAYRNAECRRRAEAMAPGTGSGDAYLACLIELAELRRRELAGP